MNLAIIGSPHRSGLGTLTEEFVRHLKPKKILLVNNNRYRCATEHFNDLGYTEGENMLTTRSSMFITAEREWLMDGIDCVLAFETFYHWTVVKDCAKRNIATALMVMYECTPTALPAQPDLFFCPSQLDFDAVRGNRLLLPVPVNTERIPYRNRNECKLLVHHAGHGGLYGRNGTLELVQAMKMVRSDVKLLITTQIPMAINAHNVTCRIAEYDHYYDMWDEGDAYVWPHKFDGLSLPIQESLAAGLPVITTDMPPYNSVLPEHWLIKPEKWTKIKISREVDAAVLSAGPIAEAIDRFVGVGGYEVQSKEARSIAVDISWETMLSKYEQALREICKAKLKSA